MHAIQFANFVMDEGEERDVDGECDQEHEGGEEGGQRRDEWAVLVLGGGKPERDSHDCSGNWVDCKTSSPRGAYDSFLSVGSGYGDGIAVSGVDTYSVAVTVIDAGPPDTPAHFTQRARARENSVGEMHTREIQGREIGERDRREKAQDQGEKEECHPRKIEYASHRC